MSNETTSADALPTSLGAHAPPELRDAAVDAMASKTRVDFAQLSRVLAAFQSWVEARFAARLGERGGSGIGYAGTWERDREYACGTFVTYAGSLWHAQAPTKDRPGTSAEWKLATKRGADGAQGPKGDIGPMPRHQWDGTKLRFEMDLGEWGKYVDLEGPPGRDGVGGGVIVRRETAAPANSWTPGGW